jgi:cell division protein FtsB
MFLGHAQPRNYLRRTLVVTAALGILAYLIASAIGGERGLEAASNLRLENAAKAERLAQIEAERAFLAKRVQALDPAHLDLDMLGEEARRVLFYSADDEIVLTPPLKGP